MKGILALLYFAGVVAEVIIRRPYERQRATIIKVDRRVTVAEYLIFGALSVAMVVLPLMYAATEWLDFADYGLGQPAIAVAGVGGAAVLSVATWLFWRAHRDLGHNWSPSLEIGERQTLVTDGVYRAIRHPMYASHLLWGVGQCLLLHNWVAGLASLATFVPLYLVRIPREERMMADRFGDLYREYSEHTGRIMPWRR